MEEKFDIDYELFDAMEIVKIIEFFCLIEKTKTKKVNPQTLVEKYKEYRNIINNKALEKQYDKMLYKKSRVSIYEVMKPYLK